MVVGAALLACVTLAVVLQRASLGTIVGLYEWPTMLPGFLGALLPVAVWARDERYGAGFLWTLPVDRRRHAQAKVLAGWVWLMGGVVLYALWLLTLTWMSGGQVVPPYTLQVLPFPVPPPGALDPAMLRAVRWEPGPLIWTVPLVAASATYLLGSAFILGTRHPLRWVIGVVLGFLLLAVAGDAARAQLGVSWLSEMPVGWLNLLVEGRYGLDMLLTAGSGGLNTTVFLTTGDRALVWRGVPDLGYWIVAALLWTTAGALALWAAIRRHRELRPS
jgi:hypothetical protein